jgi:hypothetical protein
MDFHFLRLAAFRSRPKQGRSALDHSVLFPFVAPETVPNRKGFCMLPDDPMEHPASRSVRLYGGSDGAYVQTIRGPDVLRCEVTIEQVRRLVHDGMEILMRAEDGKR